MDISMFLVFPGILITIGVFLLILSIIIVIIAYKTADKPIKNSLADKNYEVNVKEDGYYDNGKPKIILEQTTKPKEEDNLDSTKVFKFPTKTKNVPISEIDNETTNRINKMDQELAKELNTKKEDEFIKIPPIDQKQNKEIEKQEETEEDIELL